jgi:hypothetical protein
MEDKLKQKNAYFARKHANSLYYWEHANDLISKYGVGTKVVLIYDRELKGVFDTYFDAQDLADMLQSKFARTHCSTHDPTRMQMA